MTTSHNHVLVLTRYGSLGASSRIRFFQYFPYLQGHGISLVSDALVNDVLLESRYLNAKYGYGELVIAYLKRIWILLFKTRFEILWIEKEALPWFPLWWELILLRRRPYILDFDDAIFHNYDLHPNRIVRFLYGRRIDGLMRHAALVVAGNNYLAQRARDAGAGRVEVLPTVIDLERYAGHRQLQPIDTPLRIVWIGSPSTVIYLNLLAKPLQSLAKRYPFVLRAIGGTPEPMSGVEVELVDWTEETEVARIGECAVGIMPLLDSPWEQGKCGYKLIQYMACELPVVASPVGVNCEIVAHAEDGYLAKDDDEWVSALSTLLNDAELRKSMGRKGRLKVEETYCIQQTSAKLAGWLQQPGEN
jgi:glycosyltransferase involved in cell wall biosynthesis